MNDSLLDGIVHQVPEDLANALNGDKLVADRWNKLTPIQRNEWICWVISVKKEQTRIAHIARLLSDLSDGKRTPCCWPGCSHRG